MEEKNTVAIGSINNNNNNQEKSSSLNSIKPSSKTAGKKGEFNDNTTVDLKSDKKMSNSDVKRHTVNISRLEGSSSEDADDLGSQSADFVKDIDSNECEIHSDGDDEDCVGDDVNEGSESSEVRSEDNRYSSEGMDDASISVDISAMRRIHNASTLGVNLKRKSSAAQETKSRSKRQQEAHPHGDDDDDDDDDDDSYDPNAKPENCEEHNNDVNASRTKFPILKNETAFLERARIRAKQQAEEEGGDDSQDDDEMKDFIVEDDSVVVISDDTSISAHGSDFSSNSQSNAADSNSDVVVVKNAKTQNKVKSEPKKLTRTNTDPKPITPSAPPPQHSLLLNKTTPNDDLQKPIAKMPKKTEQTPAIAINSVNKASTTVPESFKTGLPISFADFEHNLHLLILSKICKSKKELGIYNYPVPERIVVFISAIRKIQTLDAIEYIFSSKYTDRPIVSKSAVIAAAPSSSKLTLETLKVKQTQMNIDLFFNHLRNSINYSCTPTTENSVCFLSLQDLPISTVIPSPTRDLSSFTLGTCVKFWYTPPIDQHSVLLPEHIKVVSYTIQTNLLQVLLAYRRFYRIILGLSVTLMRAKSRQLSSILNFAAATTAATAATATSNTNVDINTSKRDANEEQSDLMCIDDESAVAICTMYVCEKQIAVNFVKALGAQTAIKLCRFYASLKSDVQVSCEILNLYYDYIILNTYKKEHIDLLPPTPTPTPTPTPLATKSSKKLPEPASAKTPKKPTKIQQPASKRPVSKLPPKKASKNANPELKLIKTEYH
jgi:hypothetical protein